MLIITCEEYNFTALSKAFDGEYISDCPLLAEVVITDKESIRTLNAEHRSVDRPTDVLSFPSLDGIYEKPLHKADHPFDIDEDGNLFIGSVVVCREVAKEQAEEFGHSFERELNYLVVHGICHLLGYDHMRDEDKVVMRAKEERILAKLGLVRD